MASSPRLPILEATPEGDSLDAVRRARKRATDRKSQRSHRERQRAYIRSLEQTLESLSGPTSGDQRIAALLSEQEALRRRCATLAAQLARIRTIASETEVSSAPLGTDLFDDFIVGEGFDVSIASAPPTPTPLDHLPQPSSAVADHAITLSHSLAPDDENPVTHTLFTDTLEALSAHANRELVPLLPVTPSVRLVVPAARSCFSTFPQYSSHQGVSDRQVQSMLEEAIAEHHLNKFDTSKPSLIRLLTDEPVNILAFRLFQFIKGYGPMPMHWMLAVFWVQYLFLRWNVLGTAEAYDLLPQFLKPTPIECAIPHRIFINMLVWPEIRQALICDPNNLDAEDLGTSLLQNLSPNWSQTFGMTGNMIASIDIYRMIEIQAVRYDFWKVEPSFFQLYPQFKTYNLGQEQ